jgi:hypothetical protein
MYLDAETPSREVEIHPEPEESWDRKYIFVFFKLSIQFQFTHIRKWLFERLLSLQFITIFDKLELSQLNSF